ncbi:MAG: hypothetical protein M3083_09660 [Actinomycetota bacterium]|nr:hypothetical protein [Actinomycetota bacterium]
MVVLATWDAALSRQAQKASAASAVVVRFSGTPRRYERQGLLVEEEALVTAEREWLADEARGRRQARDEQRRSEHDAGFHAAFAAEIRRLFPDRPAGRAEAVAQHAAAVRSGRVGRRAGSRPESRGHHVGGGRLGAPPPHAV